MHHDDLSRWQHEHHYTTGSPAGERRTLRVTVLTAVMMLVEIIAGHFLHSMALFADGWHMGTHVVALGISAFAYVYARRHVADERFAFGPSKMGPLGGYTSAIILAAVAVYIAFEAATRLLHPLPIAFNEAIAVASLGLGVNLLSAYLLRDEPHHHGHGHHDHEHGHGGANAHGADLNLRAAYIHVLADAATSVAAILALTFGKFFGWSWLDPVVGAAGGLVVAQSAYGLIRDTSRVLLDSEMDPAALKEIREAIESDGDSRVSDLHLLRVGLNEFAVVASVVTDVPRSPEDYKARIRQHEELAHVTIEVNKCHEQELALNG
jgi:cation diffusion facilitator family transporter